MKETQVDWERVELAMLRSFTGRNREDDLELCKKAFKTDPEKYSKLHKRMKDQEIDRIKKDGF